MADMSLRAIHARAQAELIPYADWLLLYAGYRQGKRLQPRPLAELLLRSFQKKLAAWSAPIPAASAEALQPVGMHDTRFDGEGLLTALTRGRGRAARAGDTLDGRLKDRHASCQWRCNCDSHADG